MIVPVVPPRAFTLIELLIVVAIIAILAAIAVPNFLEAQVRSKVSRARSNLRTFATALETYRVDHVDYPPHGELLADGTVVDPATRAGLGTVEFLPPRFLTTPVAYLTVVPTDPFLDRPDYPAAAYGYIHSRRMAGILERRGMVESARGVVPTYGEWRLYAAGPDGDKGADAKTNVPYDPTNGTVSDGDLIRSQNEPEMKQPDDERG